ncbi:helix-turn-helix domain-containing protein [Burkholderia thailandensis]|uniref:helix-turn-helix domain-containing protein n=1 Tax=Burkholderia thailandensis TaxID=57975 RepID=UPI001C11527B|nr:helix-turn-helix domain-containing protein [Burkholderia thailandensis]
MTVEEAAKYLFVSRAHIHALLTRGKLVEVLPKNPFGQLDIDVSSINAYREKMEAARRASPDSQTEDNDPTALWESVRSECPVVCLEYRLAMPRRRQKSEHAISSIKSSNLVEAFGPTLQPLTR